MRQDKKKETQENADVGLLRRVDREQGFRKAAEFLLLLQKENATQVLSRLDPEEVEGLVKEIISIKRIDEREAERVFAEYGITPPVRKQANEEITGGLEKAREMLVFALGEEKSKQILDKVGARLEPGYFDFLKEINSEQLFALLSEESSQVIALVVAFLEPQAGSKLLVRLPEELQKELVQKVAKMGKLLPEVIQRTADTLKKKLFMQADFSTQYIDGRSRLRDILKLMDVGQERTILETLSKVEPELAQKLEKELFTMEILEKIPNKELQLFFRGIGDRIIAMILKGEDEKLKDHVLSCVSARRRALILEEYELIGEVPRKEVEKEQQEFLAAVKRKIELGEMNMVEENDHIIL